MAINRRTQEERAREDLEHRCQVFRERLAQPDFLANKGIGNEIGFYTFCYDPSLEFEVRAYIEDLQRDAECSALPCDLKVINLYDAFLALCENKRILKAIPKQELKTGTQRQRDQLQKICGPAAFAKYILEQTQPHEPGDVILITGVGEVYPFLRAHDLLNNMLADFGDVPVVIAYPGSFNGQQFRLFNRLGADSYYRAFDIS